MDLPTQSVQFEDLLEVVTRAVVKLNLDWPAEEQEERPKSKLDELFLHSKPLPPCWSLPFFPNLHTEVSRLWNKPLLARLFSPNATHYTNVVGLKEHSYRAILWVEEMLVGYLSPSGASSLKALALPTKPLRTASALVGKAYTPHTHHGGAAGIPGRPAQRDG